MLWKLLSPLFKKVKSLIDSLDHFTKDWFGEPTSPGRDAIPGVMERLNRIDGELKHNGGSSMKDAMKRVEKKLAQIDERLDEGAIRFKEIEQRIE